MKIETVEVSYFVKRSTAYQTADTGMTVRATVEAGETPQGVYATVMRQIAPCVEKEAGAARTMSAMAASLDH